MTNQRNRVVVIVEGGVVQDVYLPDLSGNWEVIDYDDLSETMARDEATKAAMQRLAELGYGDHCDEPDGPYQDPDEIVVACPTCKSVRVLDQAWVDPNTDEVSDTCDRYRWFNACEEDGNDGEHKYLEQMKRSETREWQEKHASAAK